MISGQEAYLLRPISLLRWACGSLSPLKSSKTNRRFKRTQFAQEIRKDPKMKKKTISVTVTYLLISKTGSSESRSELSSMAELTRVQAECASVTWRAFSIPGSFFGKQGDLRGEREISEATHADFFRAVHPFLVYFVLFSPISFFFFFSRIKSCPKNFIYVFSLRWWISNYYL